MTDVSEKKNAAVTRRNALKAGAAVGVGAAAWGGPQIGMLGMTPAYAGVCSQPLTGYFIGCDSTRANCPNGVGFKPIGGTPVNPAGITFAVNGKFLQNFTGTGGSTSASSGCPGAPSTVTITNPSSVGLTGGCRLTVIIHDGNCTIDGPWTWNSTTRKLVKNGGTTVSLCTATTPSNPCELDRKSTGYVVGAGTMTTLNMPTIPCGSGAKVTNCGVFWSAVVECSADPDCLVP